VSPLLQPRDLSEAEIDKIVAFLGGLTRSETRPGTQLP